MKYAVKQCWRGTSWLGLTLALFGDWLAERNLLSAEPATVTVVSATPDAEWNARFAGSEGWIGGDGAYSAVLSPRRVLWLFGDTLLGQAQAGKRVGAKMVNNTIGLYRPGQEDGKLEFLSGVPQADLPTAFFKPAEGPGWYWPQAAIRLGDRLHLFLARIDKTSDPGVFGFKHIGQWLVTVENPDDAPAAWRLQQTLIPFASFADDEERSWGSAVLADGEWVYVYGYHDRSKKPGTRRLTVARAPQDKLADFSTWQFLSATGWSDEAQAATPLADGLATEFSVTARPEAGYLLVYTQNGLSDVILCRQAADAHGPWGPPTELYRCPEMQRDKGVFSYAAKAHDLTADRDDLLISYCVNTWQFSRLFQDNSVYRPQFVRVKLRTPE